MKTIYQLDASGVCIGWIALIDSADVPSGFTDVALPTDTLQAGKQWVLSNVAWSQQDIPAVSIPSATTATTTGEGS